MQVIKKGALMNKHLHPEVFQKKLYNKNYFEGWYYKLVTSDGKNTVSFIPGVSYNKKTSHCFIQCIHHNKSTGIESYNVNYPIGDFTSEDQPFSVKINENSFSLSSINLSIKSDNLSVDGKIHIGQLSPIKKSALRPNIMGFFSYMPFMECKHGVISMNHDLTGSIEINGENIDFTGGKGYIEKDWGRSFPDKYIWIQSNHFENPDASLFCSVATIPFMMFSFTGYICNFQIGEDEYRFATYTGSKLSVVEFSENRISLIFNNRKHTLKLDGETSDSKELIAPKNGTMVKTIKEVLSGKVSIVLTDKSSNIIFSATSNQCGMELVPKL